MRQAITTRYAGPTNHTSARVIAKCQTKRIVASWDDALGSAENHERAALMLVAQLGWHGNWVGGALPDGTGYCFVDASAGIELDRAALLKRVYAVARPVYTVAAGRSIERDGKPYVYVGRDACDVSTPVEADECARLLCTMLNAEVK